MYVCILKALKYTLVVRLYTIKYVRLELLTFLIYVITQQTMRPLKLTNDHILIFRSHFIYKLRPEFIINSKFATYKMANHNIINYF